MDYKNMIKDNPIGVLATRDGKGVSTRIVHSFFMDGDKVMFSTSSDKHMYKQMKENPRVSFCVHADNFNPVISLQGKVVWVEDLATKERILDENSMLKNIYKAADNYLFKPFYITDIEVNSYVPGEGTTRERVSEFSL